MTRRVLRISVAISAVSATAFAQTAAPSGGTNFTNPANIVWGIVAIMGAMASAFFAMSLIWTSIQGAVSDHDHFQKLPRIVFWGAMCFSATYIAGRFALGG